MRKYDFESLIKQIIKSGGQIPYYFNTEDNTFGPLPWHYIYLKDFSWYRKYVGGRWEYVKIDDSYYCWMRLKPQVGGAYIEQAKP